MIDHLSVSQVRTWNWCQRMWWAQKMEKKTLPSSSSGELGSSFGMEVVKRIGAHLNEKAPDSARKQTLPVTDEVEALVKTYLGADWAWTKGCDVEAEFEVHLTPKRIKDLAQTFGVEKPRGVVFAPFIGYIDLYRRFPTALVDLKTSGARGFQIDWMFQVLMYALAVNTTNAEVHLVTRTKTPVAYRYKVPVTDDTCRWAVSKLIAAYSDILRAMRSRESIVESPGYWCEFCPELDCPIRFNFNFVANSVGV